MKKYIWTLFATLISTISVIAQVSEELKTIEDNKLLLSHGQLRYKATVWNSNFTIPAVKFNFAESNSESNGSVSFFNSVGAGFGRSKGEVREIRDEKGDIINQDFTNTFAWYIGVLFSAQTGEETRNHFAPMVSVVILDFQIGLGYELGDILPGNSRSFITIGYNIPIFKLKRGGYYITRSSELIDDSDFGAGRLGN